MSAAPAPAPTAGTASEHVPWVFKHRPRTLDAIVGNEAVLDRLRALVQSGTLPHLILAGPPGCGKTSALHCLARAFLGRAVSTGLLELNASDDRGIGVIRDRVKQFAKAHAAVPGGALKIVFLDESDALTPGAQQALRRVMEVYSDTTRFVFACNQADKLIDALQSRCAVFHFAPLQDDEARVALQRVIAAEHVTATPAGIDAVLFTAHGDLRQAYGTLQAVHAGFGGVTPDNVYRICDVPNPDRLRAILRVCRQGDFAAARKGLFALTDKGYMAIDVLATMFRVCEGTPDQELGEYLRLEYIKELALAMERLVRGLDSSVQLLALLARLCHIAAHGPTEPI